VDNLTSGTIDCSEMTGVDILQMIGLCFTETQCVMALQGHPRSLILAPIESAYATFYWSSIVTLVLLPIIRDISGFLRRATPPIFHPNFRDVPLRLDCRCYWESQFREIFWSHAMEANALKVTNIWHSS